ncbi:dihydrodipicolinate synthase family protein [Novosphingobium flavum]|uniref:Dihydrodipicolinate synthase family protein n=1 Tax=Novosphingobium flavum TaxID=1778672 RepID=A0A7X1KMI0_9SPHN|nr:dihydrodipicolinate synthase family protein [Novosphingobium flavum]MBC2666642.1 dihydrodipicolinate synthase family protein [Novosphingobium flavum]
MLLPEGLNPGAYTPFDRNGRLNQKQLAEELRLVTRGVGGLHGPSTHAEYVSLTLSDWKAWAETVIDVAQGAGVKAWPFLGSESFEKTLEQATHAMKLGADGIFVMAPYFNKYSQESAFEYYRDIASTFSDTPIVIYPSHMTGNHFSPATIARIAALPNIVGIKMAPDNEFADTAKIVLSAETNPSFNPVAGGLLQLYPLMKGVDIKASCSALSNFAHDWSLNLWTAYLAKDWPTVRKWHLKLARIAAVLSSGPGGGAQAGHKAAIRLLGRDVGEMRRPGLPATDEHVARIRKVFEEEGLFESQAANTA